MRVISQDCTKNIPYNISTFSVVEGKNIYVTSPHAYFKIAEYKTKERTAFIFSKMVEELQHGQKVFYMPTE